MTDRRDLDAAGSPVTAVRRTSRGPSAGLALASVAAALAGAIVIAVAAGPAPQPSPSAAALVSGSPAPSTASPATPTPQPSASVAPVAPVAETVVVLRVAADPAGVLGALTGCAKATRVTTSPLTPAVKGASIDQVADSAGRDSGWVFVPPGIQASSRVWLGDDLVKLARGAGQQLVAVDPQGEVWLGGRAGATRWVPIATPEGRTGWVMASDAMVGGGACSPWTLPTLIDGQRSVTCSGVGEPACLRTVSAAVADVRGMLFPGGDVVVSAVPCRVASTGCSGSLVSVIAAPFGWPVTTTAVRAALPDPATGVFSLTDEQLLPTSTIAALSRASLPLPAGGEKTAGNDCSDWLSGELHGNPWDPRVVWVGDLQVVWPTGTSAWFAPDAIVEVIGRTDGAAARAGDRVSLTGRLDATGQRFDACTMQLSFALGPTSSPLGDTPATTPGPPNGRGTGS